MPPRMPDYELIRCVGTGTFGDVWLARAKATQRFRAIKLVCRTRFPREGLYETEFTGLKKFEEISREHAGFIDILHVSRDDEAGCFSYVMELADDLRTGQSFEPAEYVPKTVASELARRQEPDANAPRCFTPAECVQVGLSLTSALVALHQNGLAHRDIKPSNIVFVRGVAKLADVGLVAEFQEASKSTLIGSPPFMDPDVHGTPLGDLYAFGKVLYTMATGRPVQDWPDVTPVMAQGEDAASFHELLHISQKACGPDRSQRYQTAEDIHKQLLLLRVGHSLRRLQRLEQIVGSIKRFAAVATVIAVLAGLILYQTIERRKQSAELRQHRVGSFVAYGTRALDDNDLLGALPWFAEALRQDTDNPRTEPVHRLRLGMLLQQCPTIIQMWFTDHLINYAQFAGQENQVLLPAANCRWAIHDLATGRMLHAPFGPVTGSDTVAISPASGLAVTSSLDSSNNVVEVWNYLTSQPVTTLPWPTGVKQATISPDGRWVAAAARTNLAIVWSLAGREPVWRLAGHTRPILSLAFSPDGHRLVTAGGDRTAVVWDLRTGAVLSQFTNHTSWIYSAVFGPDGRHVATAGFDRCARIWEADTAREVLPPLRHDDGVHSVEFSSDGTRLITAGLDFLVRVWDVQTGELLQQLRHNSKPLYASFSPSGRYLVTACYDGTERVWSLRPPRFAPQPTPAAFSADGLYYATPTNQSIRVSEARAGNWAGSVPVGNQRLLRVLLNRDGSRVLTLAEPPPDAPTNTLQAVLCDRKTGARIGKPALLDLSSTNLVLSPDGRLAWAAARGRDIVWDFARDREVLGLPSSGQTAAFDGSSRFLAFASDSLVQIWDLSTGEARLRASCPHQCYVGSVEWSPDGRHVITGCYDDTFNPAGAQVFDSLTGRRAGPALNHRDGVRFATFSPDAGRVITCGEDSVAMLWEWATGRQLAPPLRHRGQVLYAAFSRDGRRIATASRDGSARVWDADTGEPITQNLQHPQEVVWLQWVNRGGGLLTRTRAGEMRLWNLLPDARPLAQLVQVSELLSAQQMHATGSVMPETKEALRKLWEALRSDYPADFSVRP
ncbi:MAG TPA: WD40 repeat domain-containing serine/threonine-protein kinase [Verrucomicrobiae bacterium]